MSDGSTTDPVVQAAMRLEAAVERLAHVAAARAAAGGGGGEGGAGGGTAAVSRAQLADLAGRLDATIARLRATLGEEEGEPAEEEQED